MTMSSVEQYNDVKKYYLLKMNMYETLDEKEQLAFLIAATFETSFSYYKCNLAKKRISNIYMSESEQKPLIII